MHSVIRGERETAAVSKIAAAADTIAEAWGMEEQAQAIRTVRANSPELRRLFRLEAVAVFMTALADYVTSDTAPVALRVYNVALSKVLNTEGLTKQSRAAIVEAHGERPDSVVNVYNLLDLDGLSKTSAAALKREFIQPLEDSLAAADEEE